MDAFTWFKVLLQGSSLCKEQHCLLLDLQCHCFYHIQHGLWHNNFANKICWHIELRNCWFTWLHTKYSNVSNSVNMLWSIWWLNVKNVLYLKCGTMTALGSQWLLLSRDLIRAGCDSTMKSTIMTNLIFMFTLILPHAIHFILNRWTWVNLLISEHE